MQGSLAGSISSTVSFNLLVLPPNLIASTTVNQNYNIDTGIGAKSYIVPSFTTNPIGYDSSITYSDVRSGVPLSVTFD